MASYPQALALTVLIEAPIYVVSLGPVARAVRGPVLPWHRALMLGILVNLASHPLAFLVVFPLIEQTLDRTAALVIVEVGVLVFEAGLIWLRVPDMTVAVVASSLANVTSLALGALLVT